MKCICCEEELIKVNYDAFNGFSDEILVGDGSQFDFCVFDVAICDSCIEEKAKKEILVYKRNHFQKINIEEFKTMFLNKKYN